MKNELQIFIDGQRVDTSDSGQSVTIKKQVKDLKSLDKVFTSFSRSINIPASKTNNKIFKHYYNADIVSGTFKAPIVQSDGSFTASPIQTGFDARALVNAAGPWVAGFFKDALTEQAPKQIRMVKGSHIVVPKLHDQPEAYILQNEDGRIVFVIPYEEGFSLVGTTDEDYSGAPEKSRISDAEIDYLIAISNSHFKHKISRDDIVHTFSGVRPLIDDESTDAQTVTRDYSFEVDNPDGAAPLISVFGGKITTYRKLAESLVDKITEFSQT